MRFDKSYSIASTFLFHKIQNSELGIHWGKEINQTHTYSNNRESGSQYDADGRITSTSETGYISNSQLQFVYDAAGQITTSTEDKIFSVQLGQYNRIYTSTWRWVDGDGQLAGHRATTSSYGNHHPVNGISAVFYIRSSVLKGSVVNEFNPYNYYNHRSFVFAFGNVLAIYLYNSIHGFHSFSGIEHRDPSNTSYAMTKKNEYNNTSSDRTFLDPSGRDVGSREQYEPGGQSIWDDDYTWSYPGLGSGGAMRCLLDGVNMGCRFVFRYADSGMGAYVPESGRFKSVVNKNGQKTWAEFRVFADGTSGYRIPIWGNINMLELDGTVVSRGKPGIIGWDFVSEDELLRIVKIVNLVVDKVKFVNSGTGKSMDDETNQLDVLKRIMWMIYYKPCGEAFRSK